MTAPHPSPTVPRRALAAAAAACSVAVLAGCGGSGGATTGSSSRSTEAAATVTTTSVADAPRIDPDLGKDAAGAAMLCGPASRMRTVLPVLRRYDAANDRVQVSTLGFPDGDGRPLRAFRALVDRRSHDCDAFVADDPADVAALAAAGDLYDLRDATKDWTDGAGHAVPGAGQERFGLAVRVAGGEGMVVVSAKARNPGGGLELARVLAGLRRAP